MAGNTTDSDATALKLDIVKKLLTKQNPTDTMDPKAPSTQYIQLFKRLALMSVDLFDAGTEHSTEEERAVLIHQLTTLHAEMGDFIEDSLTYEAERCKCFRSCVEGVGDVVEYLEDVQTVIEIVQEIASIF